VVLFHIPHEASKDVWDEGLDGEAKLCRVRNVLMMMKFII